MTVIECELDARNEKCGMSILMSVKRAWTLKYVYLKRGTHATIILSAVVGGVALLSVRYVNFHGACFHDHCSISTWLWLNRTSTRLIVYYTLYHLVFHSIPIDIKYLACNPDTTDSI